MKPNVLRGPLIKSAIVLIIFSLLVYFTGSSAEGSVWSAIGIVVVTALKTIQWLIGLSIGLIVCIAVLIGIFFGAVAMKNPSAASQMYEGLRRTLVEWLLPIVKVFKSDHKEHLTSTLNSFGSDLKKEINADILAARNMLEKNHGELENKISSLSSRLTALEETASDLVAAEQVETLADEVKNVVDSTAEIKGSLDTLKSSVEQTAKQIQEVSGETILGEIPARIEALEQQEIPEPPPAVDITPLQNEITQLQTALSSMQQKVEQALETAAEAAEKAAAPGPEEPAEEAKEESAQNDAADGEHRIFSYFDDPADKNKVADLVTSTLKKDMSYKQVMDFVAKELGGAKGKIITSHPSLSKDYIRQCRKNS